MTGHISIRLDGATFEQTEYIRRVINTLFEQGVFNVRNGSAILHFDHTGVLQQIDIHATKWKKDKMQSFTKLYDKATIEIGQSVL